MTVRPNPVAGESRASAANPPVVGSPLDLLAGAGPAVVWGLQTDDLNVNLVAWPPGGGVASHRNEARDVLLVMVDGDATVEIDGAVNTVRAGQAIIVGKGCERSITAGPAGVRYVTAHHRRPPLDISR